MKQLNVCFYLLPFPGIIFVGMERWEGRVALVTGATSGIGRAIAIALVQHKMKVIGCGRQIDKLQVSGKNKTRNVVSEHLKLNQFS